jgi:tripartite-type tricarboxylate transporter receptor subunit TctC
MKLSRRQSLHLAAGAAALPVASRLASAQTYPSRPVRVIESGGAGGASDIVARLVGQWLSEHLGRQFIIDNRTGAAGNIATEVVVRAPPDGYTLLLIGPFAVINATLYDHLNFNFIRDIEPVASIIRAPLVLMVNPSVPVKTIPELIAYAKAHPGKLNMASSGVGTTNHVAGELFKTMSGTNIVHVPYRSTANVTADLLSGQVQVYSGPLASWIELIRSGRLRALAVTGATRTDMLPEVPAVAEFVPGYEATLWYGVGAPKNTPVAIVNRLNSEINAALASPVMKAQLADLGATPLVLSPADFGTFIADETEKWAKVIRAANIKPLNVRPNVP